MMETTRNRSAILAQFLRAAVATINNPRAAFADVVEAVASVGAVAEELEIIAGIDSPAHSPEPQGPGVSTSADENEIQPRVGEREPSTGAAE